MKSLQSRLTLMLAFILGLSIVPGTLLVQSSRHEIDLAREYILMNKITGNINEAAGWQAIERGAGAALLGNSAESDLIRGFEEMGSKGDAKYREVENLFEQSAFTISRELQPQMEALKAAHARLVEARKLALSHSIGANEWFSVATKNIEAEFVLRDAALAPRTEQEKVYYFNSVLRTSIATLAEYAGRERAIIGNTIATGTPIERNNLESLIKFRSLVDNASGNILALKNFPNVSDKLLTAISEYEQEFLGSYQTLREQVYAASEAGEPYPITTPAWITRSTKAIDTAIAISNLVGQLSTEAAANVETSAWQLIILNSGLGVFAWSMFALILIFIRRSIVFPIKSIKNTLGHGSREIYRAASEISASSQTLAAGAQEQAVALQETAAALEEMSAASRNNAQNAGHANDLARSGMTEAQASARDINEMIGAVRDINKLAGEARSKAREGSAIMTQTIEAMDEITKSSAEISKIIKVIDEIAFQTNILSLNATVEAARAGKHGKGFAVVAEEVRNLAHRSAMAAKDTEELIQNAIKKTAAGSDMADRAGKMLDSIIISVNNVVKKAEEGDQSAAHASKSLEEILDSIKKVTNIMAEIASASLEQAQGVEQVNMAVTQMEKVTQLNASNAEHSATASEELHLQSQKLNDVVIDLDKLVTGGVDMNGFKKAPEETPATTLNRKIKKLSAGKRTFELKKRKVD